MVQSLETLPSTGLPMKISGLMMNEAGSAMRSGYVAPITFGVISANTISFHYGKHHQAYVTNLNNLIKGTEFENMSLEDIVKKSSGGMFNNYAIVQGVDHVVPVDVYLPGCPPRPEMLIDAILEIHDKIQNTKLGVNREREIAQLEAEALVATPTILQKGLMR